MTFRARGARGYHFGMGNTELMNVREDHALVPRSLEEVATLAKGLANSKLMPGELRATADIVVTILQGMELGLKPMQAIRMVHVVEGRPVLSADLIVALCMRSAACEYFQLIASTDTAATYETRRVGAPSATRLSWTMEMAQQAGLAQRPNWKRHPAAMLRARCKAALAREVFPDVASGVYTADEDKEIQRKEPPAERTPPRTRKTRVVAGKERNTAPLPLAAHDFRSGVQDVDDDLPPWAGGEGVTPGDTQGDTDSDAREQVALTLDDPDDTP